jgi:hypothetical protein
MESGTGTDLPLKVCRHCSVASRTDASSCPNCGRSYARGGLSLPRFEWRGWLAIPIIALAFAIGYFGLSELVWDDEEADTITQTQAEQVPDATARDELAAELGGLEPSFTRSRRADGDRLDCLYYALDEEGAAWEFCFRDEALVTSVKVGGEGGLTP